MRSFSNNSSLTLNLFDLYPNPASNYVEFRIADVALTIDAKIVIYNMVGAVIHRQNIPPGQDHLIIPLADFETGIYSVVLEDKNLILQTKKLLIE